MKNFKNLPPQTMLFVRIFAGGYLVYLAWNLYREMPEGLLYWIPVIAFAVIGLALVVVSFRSVVLMNMEEAEAAARAAAEAAALEEEASEEDWEEENTSDL